MAGNVMNIDKLEAGRELDALVAERVMGWELEFPSVTLKSYPFSTDISAAWLVEERIDELGLIDYYCLHLNAISNSHWEEGKRKPQRWQLIHATPEDRCKAALKAVERDVV